MRDNLTSSTALCAPATSAGISSCANEPKPKYLRAVASARGGAARCLARGGVTASRLSLGARAVPLWAVVLSATVSGGLSIVPARAQGTLSGQGVAVPSVTILVGENYTIDLPQGAHYNPTEVDQGVRVLRETANSGQRNVVVEGLADGVGRIDVTWKDGSVHSYSFTVGTGKPQPLVAASTQGGAGASESPLPELGMARGSGLPGGLTSTAPTPEMPNLSESVPIPAIVPSRASLFPIQTKQLQKPSNGGRTIHVTAGLARFVGFRQNILSVYFSNTNAMDARALTARTVAITGLAKGSSTLAINVAQSPTDTIGRVEIFNIEVDPSTPNAAPSLDPASAEAAIRAAIYDPRVGVHVFPRLDGTLAVYLTGALHDAAEKTAAEGVAALFVPEMHSALYIDPYAPTLSQVLNPITPSTPLSTEAVLQSKLRQVTGNDSIELVSLPGALAVKAQVDSAEDAEALLGLLPDLNTRVLPFIVVRGHNAQNSGQGGDASGAQLSGTSASGGEGKYYGANRPVLNGEDLQITRRLQEVTGIRTVSVARTALNALAVYGTVRDRIEYDTVKRYAVLLPMFGSGVSSAAQTRTISAGGLPGSGQSVGGAAGAASGAGGLGRPQFSPALQNSPLTPFFQSQAQVTGGTGGTVGAGGVGAGAGTGAMAPTASGAGVGVGIGTGTGAVAPPAPNTTGVPGAAGVGAFGTGTVGTGNFGAGVGFVPGLGAGGFAGGSDFSQTQSSSSSPLGTASFAGGWPLTINAAQQPSTGYRQDINIQMFVRILDPRGQSVRRVTVESNIVEISRTSLKNLGVEPGSATLLSESVAPGSPPVTTRTINPSENPGVFTLGNGFVGQGSLGNIDPLRFRLNALYQNGNARILSRPNISAVEGADAQIVIGGERPVPSSVATGQAVGQSIVFRRFGIILTMRPTVTDDNTIILQIRADVTELAPEYGINLNGALIPGERVRSVNTTITVRAGDTFVLGGLITNDRRQQTSRIPILSSLPIIGPLFRSKRFEHNESELAIFMTPRIDSLNTTVNTQEAVNRVPALPALPDSATGASAFGALGSASQ